MCSKTWMRSSTALALVVMSLFVVMEVEAQRFGGRGGGGRSFSSGAGFSRSGAASSGSFGGSRSHSTESFSRSGAASSGSWQTTRSQMQPSRQGSASQMQAASTQNQQNRQASASERQSSRQTQQDQNREDWQQHQTNRQEDRQSYGQQRQEDRQEYGDDWAEEHYHGGYYGGGRYYNSYPTYPAGGVAAGIVIGSTLTAAAFSAQKSSCSAVSVNGMTYYQCGSTWYQPSYQGGNVTYIVVNAPK